MTMVSTGPISLGGSATTGGLNQSVNTELGRAATATINMSEGAVRTLAGVPSGAISMSNFYSKSNEFAFTIGTNQTNVNLRTLAVNAGWNENSRVAVTVAPGVFIVSNSTGTPALTVNGAFPNGVTLTNNGSILGMGGLGGNGATSTVFPTGPSPVAGTNGSPGGLALSVSVAVTIANNGTIGGGGGGGGGGGTWFMGSNDGFVFPYTGGPGGGGRVNGSGGTTPSAGGWGGQSGSGQSGTLLAPGGATAYDGGTGGAGGDLGASGSSGTKISQPPGDFVHFTAGPYSGGSPGGAISGNSNITWLAFGTRIGAIT